ncbi:hypothetical protein ACSQ67_018154 [Phaseolus vulgaris]
MRKKRKGSETDASADLDVILSPNLGSASSNLKAHYSLEDCSRLKKRCCKEEDAATEPAASFKRRLAGIATAPPCGTSSLITPGRGLKRKIGCIDVATQMGRKKKIEDDYVSGETIGQGKFGSVWLCRSRVSGAEYACQNLTGLAGSPAYVAPEVLLGRYSEKVDIWSAGVLLHALLVGSLPFQGDSLEAVFEAIKTVKLDFQTGMWESISKPARDLIGRMLTRDISARISADEVLRHPWILFYTAQTLTMLPIKTKLKNQIGATCPQLVAVPEPGLGGNRMIDNYSLSEGSFSESCTSDDQDECVLIDVLASAISHVRISEPKRSRVCGPTGPIVQQGSSNMKPNNLCKAF